MLHFPKMQHFGKIPPKLITIQQNSTNSDTICKILFKKSATNSATFNERIESRERCKRVHCVDLGESFPTSIYLQNLASTQPRTSPSKFGGKIQFIIHLPPCRRSLVEGSRAPAVTNLAEPVLSCIDAKFSKKVFSAFARPTEVAI